MRRTQRHRKSLLRSVDIRNSLAIGVALTFLVFAFIPPAFGAPAVNRNPGSNSPGRNNDPASATQGKTYTLPSGVPAIRLRTSPASTSIPAFTLQDAIDYVSTHPVPRAKLLASIVVTRGAFMTDGQLALLLHGESTGLPSSTIVCYIEFHGDVQFLNGPPGTTPRFSKGYEVFDARTGNLLMWGGLV